MSFKKRDTGKKKKKKLLSFLGPSLSFQQKLPAQTQKNQSLNSFQSIYSDPLLWGGGGLLTAGRLE